MQYQTIQLSENLLVSMNMNAEEFLLSMRKEYAKNLFHEGKLTLVQSAGLCGMNIYDFMALLSLSNIPVISYGAEELENELEQYNCLPQS